MAVPTRFMIGVAKRMSPARALVKKKVAAKKPTRRQQPSLLGRNEQTGNRSQNRQLQALERQITQERRRPR